MPDYRLVGANIDTWMINVIAAEPSASSSFSPDLAEELELLKQMAQEAED